MSDLRETRDYLEKLLLAATPYPDNELLHSQWARGFMTSYLAQVFQYDRIRLNDFYRRLVAAKKRHDRLDRPL